MAFSFPGQKTNGEVTSINRHNGDVRLLLDTAEEALLPKGRQTTSGLREGMVLTVLVISSRDGDKPFHIVSERLDDRTDAEYIESDVSDVALVQKYPVGKMVSGVVLQSTGTAVIVQLADGTKAELPYTNLCGAKKESFRRNCNVRKLKVVAVNGRGVILTRTTA